MSDKRYKLEDLKIGMFIEDWHELENIYGVYIYLNGYKYNDLKGEILYICEEPDTFVDNLSKERGGLFCYFKPMDIYLDYLEMRDFANE